MDMTYKFNSNTEPTEAQLEALMREVAADATNRKKAADKVFWQKLKDEVKRAEERARPILAKFGKT
jgi:hypothetical protein